MRRRAATRAAAAAPAASERYYLASQWQLAWRKLLRHRLALAGGGVLLLLYAAALFAGFVAPYGPFTRNNDYINAPPTPLRFVAEDGLHLRPVRVRGARRGRHGIAAATLRRGHLAPLSAVPAGARRAVPAVGVDRNRPPPVRCGGARRDLPVRHRRPGPRHVRAGAARRPHLAVDQASWAWRSVSCWGCCSAACRATTAAPSTW